MLTDYLCLQTMERMTRKTQQMETVTKRTRNADMDHNCPLRNTNCTGRQSVETSEI